MLNIFQCLFYFLLSFFIFCITHENFSYHHLSYSKTFLPFIWRRSWRENGQKTLTDSILGAHNADVINKVNVDLDRLTGYSWNPDLFATGSIPSIRGGLNFNNVVLFNGQQKFCRRFVCVQHLYIILAASPIEHLKCMNKYIYFLLSTPTFFHRTDYCDVTSFILLVLLSSPECKCNS